MCLPMLTVAQPLPVQVVSPCSVDSAFTIRIPVRFPEYITTVQYEWYRNDTLIAGTEKLLLPNETKISYTIPAEQANGNAVYHFKYRLHDDYPEWTTSRRYLVRFVPRCALDSAGYVVGDEEVVLDLDCKLDDVGSVVGDEEVVLNKDCKLDDVGSVVGNEEEAHERYCTLEGAGTIVFEDD